MLSTLQVRGFQSLADVTIELGAFTVVVGASNSGKSALRRALEGLATNASATGKLRTGDDLITVAVATDDGHAVVWEKGPKRNAYALATPDGTEVVQDKPGSTVTPEVAAVLGLDALNFADQFDAPYMLTLSPTAAAKELGVLTNVSALYDGIREATRRQRAHEATARTLTGEQATAEAELASFAHLPAEAERLTAAAEALAATSAAATRRQTLADALAYATMAQADIDNAAAVLALPDPGPALDALDAAGAAAVLAEALDAAMPTIRVYAEVVATPLPDAPEVPAELLAAVARSEALANDLINAQRLAADVEDRASGVAWATTELEALAAQLADIDACPLCGSTTGSLT